MWLFKKLYVTSTTPSCHCWQASLVWNTYDSNRFIQEIYVYLSVRVDACVHIPWHCCIHELLYIILNPWHCVCVHAVVRRPRSPDQVRARRSEAITSTVLWDRWPCKVSIVGSEFFVCHTCCQLPFLHLVLSSCVHATHSFHGLFFVVSGRCRSSILLRWTAFFMRVLGEWCRRGSSPRTAAWLWVLSWYPICQVLKKDSDNRIIFHHFFLKTVRAVCFRARWPAFQGGSGGAVIWYISACPGYHPLPTVSTASWQGSVSSCLGQQFIRVHLPHTFGSRAASNKPATEQNGRNELKDYEVQCARCFEENWRTCKPS